MARSARRPDFHVALLAGGSGTRFWPLSRKDHPKQFLALTGDESLLVKTWRRVRAIVPPERIWVVAPEALRRTVRAELPELRRGRLIVEPSPRDTAPAAGLACATVAKRDPTAVLGLFPTDHVVRDGRAFGRAVRRAAREAESGSLVCLGVRPDRPATGFGYLRCAAPPEAGQVTAVERFVEKPERARAARFLRSGRYLWNAGMFVWRVDRFLSELHRTAPEIHRAVSAVAAGNVAAWRRATRLSVDYAVMERARDVAVVPLDAGWDDVGSWDAAARLRKQDRRAAARQLLVDSADSVVFSGDRFVALVDVPGVAVVDTPDALLVVGRGSSEKVRKVVEALRKRGLEDLL